MRFCRPTTCQHRCLGGPADVVLLGGVSARVSWASPSGLEPHGPEGTDRNSGGGFPHVDRLCRRRFHLGFSLGRSSEAQGFPRRDKEQYLSLDQRVLRNYWSTPMQQGNTSYAVAPKCRSIAHPPTACRTQVSGPRLPRIGRLYHALFLSKVSWQILIPFFDPAHSDNNCLFGAHSFDHRIADKFPSQIHRRQTIQPFAVIRAIGTMVWDKLDNRQFVTHLGTRFGVWISLAPRPISG